MIPPFKIQIRFSDIDMLGHVNNVIYLSYFEMARVHYFTKLMGTDWDWQSKGVVLVKNDVEYLKPITLYDPAEAHLFVSNIGNKSFSLRYEIRVLDQVHTTGGSTLVCFNNLTKETIEIPEDFKIQLTKLYQHG
ncbi:MAG: thioesterase family protein [Flavobacteriia bacterium]